MKLKNIILVSAAATAISSSAFAIDMKEDGFFVRAGGAMNFAYFNQEITDVPETPAGAKAPEQSAELLFGGPRIGVGYSTEDLKVSIEYIYPSLNYSTSNKFTAANPSYDESVENSKENITHEINQSFKSHLVIAQADITIADLDAISLFAGARAGVGIVTETVEKKEDSVVTKKGEEGDKSFHMIAGLSGGLLFPINENFAVEARLGMDFDFSDFKELVTDFKPGADAKFSYKAPYINAGIVVSF